ncbi:MAG: transcriptional regulator [Betaproteobacteria bacterium RIFCSPLOWO2_12_FULL_62_13b]|nr:MAG: transcriptional regulator [Betaproteobacteria bacterium RIFCSPLOWO2_12_FULL_62_13b]
MKLQKSTSLALYSVLEFAANPGRQASAAEIAEKYGASTHHLAKVLRELGRAGLVESARGVGGGYRFSGNTKRLTLMDVIELFENISTRTGKSEGFDGSSDVGRALGAVTAEVDEIARATFRSITLDTMLKLIERQRRAATDAQTAAEGSPRSKRPNV